MSNAEKRSVSTDALETLGTVIDKNEKRDAIHLAVNPTQARELLRPGQHVGVGGTTANPVGIVDPFLNGPVQPGEWFWLVVYPRQITSLRHVWSHPAFMEEAPKSVEDGDLSIQEILAAPVYTDRISQSEAWLRAFCLTSDCPSYDTVVAAASGEKPPMNEEYGADYWEKGEEYLRFTGSDAHGEIPPEFWDHVEIVTGRKITERPTYFACSC